MGLPAVRECLRGRRVHWDYALPQHGLASEYVGWIGYGFMPGFVRVSGEIPGRDQWMVLLYELENIKNAGELAKLIEVSVEKSSSKEEFVRVQFDWNTMRFCA